MSVSVIIPTRNAERYLPAALTSVLQQTIAPLEIIVVDDGSTDSTHQIAKQYGVKYVRQEKIGVAAARNLGVQSAIGEHLAFLDADDLWLPEKLERQVLYLEQHPKIEVVFTAVEQFISEDTPHVQNEVANRLGVHVSPIISSMLTSKRIFDRVGLFPAFQGGDWVLWLQNAKQQNLQIHTLETCLTRRRIHSDNMSRVFRTQIQKDFLRILRLHLAKARERDST